MSQDIPTTEHSENSNSPRADAVPLSFSNISQRLHAAPLPHPDELDLVVGIGTGGTELAVMAAHQLELPLDILRLNFRAPDNAPQRERPQPIGTVPDAKGKRILLVDDVAVSGATLTRARELLGARECRTLVAKGREGSADIVLFSDIPSCVIWPW